MRFSDYPKFNLLLKQIPYIKRKQSIDYTIEKLGYTMNRSAVLLKNGKEKWVIRVFKKDKCLFEDASKKLSFKKAIELSRQIALDDYESPFK